MINVKHITLPLIFELINLDFSSDIFKLEMLSSSIHYFSLLSHKSLLQTKFTTYWFIATIYR